MSAFVAAYKQRWGSLEHERAHDETMRWFETLPPPRIHTPDVTYGPPVASIAVPNNDLEKTYGSKLDRSDLFSLKPHQDMVIGRRNHDDVLSQSIFYVFDISEDEAEMYAEKMRRIVHDVGYLGRSSDEVIVDVCVMRHDEVLRLPGHQWVPAQDGPTDIPGRRTYLRCPKPGTFESLERRHAQRGRRFAQYKAADAAETPTVSQTVCYRQYVGRNVYVYDLRDHAGNFVRVDMRNLVTVAGMVRHAALEAAKFEDLPDEWVNRYVRGVVQPGSNHRVSYLPLPSQGHQYIDRLVRRLVIAEPFGAQERWFENIVFHLGRRRSMRPLESENKELSFFLTPTANPWMAQEHYVAPSDTWVTVTPIVLPDTGGHLPIQTLLKRSLKHAHLSSHVRHVELSSTPFLRNTPCCSQFKVPTYLRGRRRVFARLYFREPISGPIAIGDGRHIGLGLFTRC